MNTIHQHVTAPAVYASTLRIYACVEQSVYQPATASGAHTSEHVGE